MRSVNIYRDRIVSMKFMRKYIHVAKDMKPTLTRSAADFIADEYSKLRNQDNLQQESIARVCVFLWIFCALWSSSCALAAKWWTSRWPKFYLLRIVTEKGSLAQLLLCFRKVSSYSQAEWQIQALNDYYHCFFWHFPWTLRQLTLFRPH